jgi:hypothetical protein
MTQKQFFASVLAVSGALIITGNVLYWQTLIADLEVRFPDIPKKIIRKAYRKFAINSAMQQYGDMDSFSDAKMDELFLLEVRKIVASKIK